MRIQYKIITIIFACLLSIGCAKKCGYTTSACGEKVDVCCSFFQCSYTFNGKEYPCDGKDCRDAADELAKDICGGLSKETAQQLIDAKDSMGQNCTTCP